MEKRACEDRRPEEEEEEEERKEEEEEEEEALCGDVSPFVVKSGGDGGDCGGDGGGDTPASTTSTTTEEELTFVKKGWGARHTVIIMACTGVILLSMTRYSMSIALVSMVGSPSHAHAPNPAHTNDSSLEGVVAAGVAAGACPAPENVTVDVNFNDTNGRFDWNERTQGLVLGAFYYGNVMTNVLGGRMAERMGSKPIILIGVFLSSALTLLCPAAAFLSTNVFIALRLCVGFAQGLVMPAVSRCLALWVPPYKRSKYNTIVFLGCELGIMLSLSVGGWLCSNTFLGGWPAVFYVFGGAGLVWCVVWGLVIHDSPETHTRITSEEKKYLMAHCAVRRDKVAMPWSLVVRSLPFWAVTVMHIGYNWGYYTFVTELPVYLSNMQHFSIKSNGMVSALPYLIKTTFGLLFSLIMDRATAKGKLSVLNVRRISMVVASYLPAAALIGMCFVGCDSYLAVLVLSASVGVTGSAFCGLFCSHQDISPHFAGTIYGVTNTVANITGFVAPALVGVITFENQTVSAWNTVFIITCIIYIISCTFYITCISDQVQPFNSPPKAQKIEDGLQETEKMVDNYNFHQRLQSPKSP